MLAWMRPFLMRSQETKEASLQSVGEAVVQGLQPM